MPELPEVETSCRGIAPHVKNTKIASVVIRQAQLRWSVPPALSTNATNAKIQDIARRGKYILITTNQGTIIIHLGMSGNLRILPADTPILKHDHVDIVLNTGKCLRFNDPRRFGCILWTTDDPLQHKLLTKLGVEPLTDCFTADYLFKQSRNKKIAIKQLIMNSHVVVGVGNIYACEALFAAGILPTTAAGKISKARYIKLVSAIKDILARAIDIGGTTLRDFLNSEGKPGYFKQQLNVYGRAGLACKRCQGELREIKLNNRSTVYCSHCQC